jgi:tetratricopeptide (TPR) repeat protein
MQDYSNSVKCYTFTIDVAPEFDPDSNLRVILIHSPVLAPGFVKALAQEGYYEQGLKLADAVVAADPDFDIKVDLLQLKDDITKLYEEKKAKIEEEAKRKKKRETILWSVSLVVLIGTVIGLSIWGYLFIKRSSARVAFGQGKNNYVIAEQRYFEYMKYDRNINEALTYFNEARRYFEESVKTQPDEYMSWYMLGNTCMKLRDIEFTQRLRGGRFNEKYAAELLASAKEAQENAIKYEPDYPEAHYELARVYFEMLDKKNAQDQCNQAINYAKKVYSEDRFKLDQLLKQCNILQNNINKNLKS